MSSLSAGKLLGFYPSICGFVLSRLYLQENCVDLSFAIEFSIWFFVQNSMACDLYYFRVFYRFNRN